MQPKKFFLFLFFSLLMTFLLPNYAGAALVFTFEAAGVQSTTVQAGEYNVETFNNGKVGSSVIGSFSGSYTVKTADQYGGANGTKYAFCNDGTPLSLSFPEPVGYFGFWWSAGDDGNILEITTANGNTSQYTTADLKGGGLLGNSNTSLYYGNPNDNPIARQNRRNTGEPYAFLNFFATDNASKITSVKLRGANFEADNFTTAVNRQPITGTSAQKGKVCSAPQSAGTYPNCSCPPPKILNTTGSACIDPPTPTVTPQSVTVAATSIVITGTVGSQALAATGETFKVTVSNNPSKIYVLGTDAQLTLDATRTNWTLTLTGTAPMMPAKQSPGYDVTATRNTTNDTNSGELTVTAIFCPTLEAVSGTIPSYALSDNGKKVTICHKTSSATNPFTINTISINALDTHLTEHSDYFSKSGACPTDAVPCPPLVCTLPAILNQAGDACIVPNPPTANDKTTFDLVPFTLDGNIGTSTTISSVTLTKIKDGLNATVTGAAATPVSGTPLTATASGWTVSSGTGVTVGTYTITATDGNSLSATGTLTVTCPTGKVATATSCVTATAPTATDKSTTDLVTVMLDGNLGNTKSPITNVTLTKTKDGLGATATGTTTIATGITNDTTAGTWSVSSGSVAVGTYNIVPKDGNNLTGSAVLTVTCPTGKVATATSCVIPTAPTVFNATTTDLVPVNILGTFGSSTNTATFSVTLTKSSTNAITTLGVVSLDPPTANGWKVSSGALTVGTYSIVARDSNLLSSNIATLTVTCADSKVANSTSSSCISAPTVTASQTFSTTTPVIVGTVGSSDAIGNPALDLTESFSVTINNVTYNRNNAALSVSGTAWALTIPTTTPLTAGQSYPVVATRDGTLNGNGTITISVAPSVDVHPDTYDTTPILTGRIGDSALATTDTFSVKINNKTYSYVAGSTTDGSVIVNADLTWRLTIPTADKLTAATYPIEAIRNTLTGTGSIVIKPCALPNVVNEAADTCSLPIPTVESATWDSNTTAPRVISGTIGTATALGSDETFAITIGTTTPLVYAKPNSALSISNSGAWTLTIPTSTDIVSGTYSVEAARNTTAKNTDAAGKLVVRLVCQAPLKDVGGKCEPVKPIDPTITSRSTTDKVAATLDGTVGTSTSLVITITDSNGTVQSTGLATLSGTSPNQTWSYIAPILPEGTYTIIVTGNSGNPATGTLEVTSSSSSSTTPTVTMITSDNAFDIALSRQMVSTPATVSIEDTMPTLSGTIGTRVINNDSFSVTISKPSDSYGAAYSKTYTYAKNSSVINLNSTAWSLPVTESLAAGIYEINAVRNSTSDETHNELRIGIDACDISVTPHVATLVLRLAVDGTHYVLGDCRTETKTNPGLYPKPQDLQPEDVVANPLSCPSGSELNKVNVTNATIKRGSIANAVTVGGTVNLLSSGATVLKYSVLSGGTLNLAGANIVADGLSATGVTLTGVTLSEVYIDTATDFINADGSVNTNSGTTYLDVRGGVTNSSGTITYEGTTVPSGILTGGIITSGKNVTDNSAARGTLLRGSYDVNTTNGAAILTKGRRVNGTVTGVSISGATVTTACNNNTNPCNSIKTVVEGGTISAGSFSNSPTTQTFGTVLNATVGNGDANITNTNYCFTSGKVGSRGQLNWKEVVQD